MDIFYNKKFYKKHIVFVAFFFIAVFLLTSSVSGADYRDIRNSVNSASSGDTINLNNTAYTSDGSSIRIEGKNLTISGSSDSNRATLNGGDRSGAFLIDSDSKVIFRFINFVGASSPRFHAIASNGTVLIENCTFSSCNGDSGAAIYLYENADSSRIVNCRFIDNKADNTDDNDYTAGGAICINEAAGVEVRNSYFSGNTALNSGGAITIRNNAQNTKIIGCTFVNNSAPNGGAIYNQLSTGTIIEGCTFTNNKATELGGAIYSINTLNISNSNFNNNSAKNGGAIYSTNQMRITGSSFATNTATDGGAIYSTNTLSISSSSFNKNTAKGNGGGLFLSGSHQSTITGNSKFTSNSAKNGGAIYTSSPLTIFSSNLDSNEASTDGGAIYSTNTLSIGSSSFNKNTAKGNGGALFLSGSHQSTITGNSKFTSNSAKNGGAIYTSSPLTISSSNLASNKVSANGGAIYSTNSLNVTGGIISGNSAIYGSGIYNSGVLRLNSVGLLANIAKVSIAI
ncbi:right-handed parallel beta-helix repeat-containing protein, partial [Methanobrevibacter cuticularis]|uniref:right-handed parallel beta-helix repeat-containing protein n=1 Tax=Methanobrevibacter cuticularis TaxID=47311 RepID=UPI000A6BA2EC